MKIEPYITNNYIEASVRGRITPYGECVSSAAQRQVVGWQETGSFVVANAGGYDMFGLNHLRGLIQARIIGAAYKLGENSLDSPSDVYDLAASDEIKMIVSVDTNQAIHNGKSFRSESGSIERPVLDWDTRARMIALQAFGSSCNLVDFITRHGPQACSICNGGCVHEKRTYSVASTGADLTVVKSISEQTQLHPDSLFHVIDEADGAFVDRLLCSRISTTALIKYIKGEV
jgi:hypothetical protein